MDRAIIPGAALIMLVVLGGFAVGDLVMFHGEDSTLQAERRRAAMASPICLGTDLVSRSTHNLEPSDTRLRAVRRYASRGRSKGSALRKDDMEPGSGRLITVE
jgi:hypothetical protein